jgi:agmatinase
MSNILASDPTNSVYNSYDDGFDGVGIRTFSRLPYSKNIDGDLDMIVAGIPFDTLTTARPGTRLGPTGIRAAYIGNTCSPDLNVDTVSALKAIDWGDIPVENGNTMETFHSISDHIEKFASTGAVPLTLGGDHSMAFAELMGYKRVYKKLAIVHFDSHSDTGYYPTDPEAPYDHGTPFYDAITHDCVDTEHSIQIGMRGLLGTKETHDFAHNSGMDMLTATQAHDLGIDGVARAIRKKVGNAPVFVTFDIDFLDPAYAPGTGTPEGGGFTTWEALEMIRKGLIGQNIKGFDLVCVNPTYDNCQVTCMAAARIAFEFMSLIAAKKRKYYRL